MAIDYNVFYSSKGAAYRKEKVVSWSAYYVPVDTTPGRLAGNSRIWGDASHEVQRKVIDAIIVAAKKEGFSIRRMAMLLAMAKLESGFNPDAAAGTTSASGLGQFVKDTGAAFGLNESNRFEIGPSVRALIAYFKENEAIAKKKKKPDYFVYKYHHDGPSKEYGGTKLATDKFAPLAATYEKALTAGHVLNILDPGGLPIADAQVKVTQKDKSAIMKTNENGALPPFLANPDHGPISVHIMKADNTFKHLGELPICKPESVWTLVAPNERVALKTHLHEPVDQSDDAPTDTHKVRPGETVSRIARDHETTYQEICKLNGIEKPYTIYPGQILKVPPQKAKKAPASASAPAAGPAPAVSAPAPAPSQSPAPLPVKPAAPAATQTPPPAPSAKKPAAPPAPLPGKPTVNEQRDQQSKHPVAKVVATAPSDAMAAAIAYAMKHKEPKSVHLCLKYVKRALLAGKAIRTYPGTVAAKDFGPQLEKEGFKNLLVTKPGTNLNTAPVGAVIIYRPVEMQEYKGKPVYGHIEIKTDNGYVSDYLSPGPTYRTNPVTMISPVGSKTPVSYKVTGIWVKD
jgi:LysM repeat protein